jgi:hypothetical protein
MTLKEKVVADVSELLKTDEGIASLAVLFGLINWQAFDHITGDSIETIKSRLNEELPDD